MEKSKNLLIIVNPYMQGGFLGLLKGLADLGATVVTEEPLDPRFIRIRGHFTSVGKFSKRNAFWTPRFSELVSICRANTIEHIHVVGEPTYSSSYSAIRMKRKAIVGSVSCRVAQNERHFLPTPFKQFLKGFEAYGGYCFPVADASKKFVEKNYNIKIKGILSNGAPDEFYEYPRNRIPRDGILYVGSFTERKGVFDLITGMATSDLCHKKLTLVGDDPRKLSLILSRYGEFSKRVTCIKKLPINDLVKFYDQAEVVIVPSKRTRGNDIGLLSRIFPIPWREQFGRVIVEAFARGTPVVGSDSGAIPELIGNPELIFEAGNPQALKKRVEHFFNEIAPKLDCEIYFQKSLKFKWSFLAQQLVREINST